MRAALIDRPGSADRDDAIAVHRTEDGWHAEVHIAAVAPLVPPDSPGDRTARQRIRSRYLPDRTIRMLPGTVERRAALRPTSPTRDPVATLRFDLRFSAEAELFSIDIVADELTAATALSYAEAATAAGDRDHPEHPMMSAAAELARALLARRRAVGALAVYDVAHGWATDEEGNLIRLGAAERNIGYIVVQELMIAANAAVARWAAERELPILFRNHRMSAVAPPRDVWSDDLTAWENEATDQGVTRSLRSLSERLALVQLPARYQPHIAGHFGLSLPAYTHATSPLRRYPDLVNQQILWAVAGGEDSPYSADELAELGERITEGLAEFRAERAQRYREAATARRMLQVEAGGYRGLEPSDFQKVLQNATEHTTPPGALVEEIDQRAKDGTMSVANACHLLFSANGLGWRDARASALRYLTERPADGIGVLTMHAGDRAVEWRVEETDEPSGRRVFDVTARLGSRVSPTSRASSKRVARQRAALALLADLAGLPSEPTEPVPAAPAIDVDEPSQTTINRLLQLGILSDSHWSFEAAGPQHERRHTAWLRMVDRRNGEDLTASGSGRTKAEAKRAATDALVTRLVGDG